MESESYEELCQRRAELEQFLQRDFDSNVTNINNNIPPNHWDYVMKEAVRSLYTSTSIPYSQCSSQIAVAVRGRRQRAHKAAESSEKTCQKFGNTL